MDNNRYSFEYSSTIAEAGNAFKWKTIALKQEDRKSHIKSVDTASKYSPTRLRNQSSLMSCSKSHSKSGSFNIFKETIEQSGSKTKRPQQERPERQTKTPSAYKPKLQINKKAINMEDYKTYYQKRKPKKKTPLQELQALKIQYERFQHNILQQLQKQQQTLTQFMNQIKSIVFQKIIVWQQHLKDHLQTNKEVLSKKGSEALNFTFTKQKKIDNSINVRAESNQSSSKQFSNFGKVFQTLQNIRKQMKQIKKRSPPKEQASTKAKIKQFFREKSKEKNRKKKCKVQEILPRNILFQQQQS